MKWIVGLVVLVVFVLVVSPRGLAVQSGGGGLQPWSKTCTVSGMGADGCSVSVTMTYGDTLCGDDAVAFCVSMSVSCSSGGGEVDCSSDANCGVCGGSATGVAVSCDGQCFSAAPRSADCWNDVAADCGCLAVRDSGHPCS